MNFVARAGKPALRRTTVALWAVLLTNCATPPPSSAIRPLFGFEVVDINGDGIDDIVGASTKGMAVVDGQTFKARMLGIKPPETWQLLNGKIITTARETPRMLQVVELRTGAVLKTFPLLANVVTLRPTNSTVLDGGELRTASNVLVQLDDQRRYLLDLKTLRLIE